MHNELQDIISSFYVQGAPTLDLIRNNAKMIGGVIGTETKYLEN